MDTIFGGGLFVRASIFIKTITAIYFIGIIKWHIAMIFWFNEIEQWKRVSVQILKKI